MRSLAVLTLLVALSSIAIAQPTATFTPDTDGALPVASPVAAAPVVSETPYDPYAEPVEVKTPAQLQQAEEEASWGYAVAAILVLLFCGLCTWDGYKNGYFLAPSYRGMCVEVEHV
eukprot:TRINITY_DN12052_c0_g1_i1.p2 TRINITY_DN12052_c0_g1~~TRINITY_DN12052_c0_g1_i1.p2  ORF type:complete len:116 (-),score=26.88 TRINITY_DN12052_c0_g1_i1:79-426(-)